MPDINQPEKPIAASQEIRQESVKKQPPPGKRIVLTTFGSFGDIHPYIAVGLELKSRGHDAVIGTSPTYREKIESTGLGFHPIRPDIAPPEENIETVVKAMDLLRGSEFIVKELFSPHVRDSYKDLREAVCDADLLITHMLTLAGPVLAQKTGIPWISTVLAPMSFFSEDDPTVPPQYPGFGKILRLNPIVARLFVSLAKRIANTWIEPVYRLRSELGLPRGGHPVFEGQHSPSLVLALFSKMLGEPQPDWPPQTLVTGFPFYDRKDGSSISPELERFLDGGAPPVVFTLGSTAIYVADDFYSESIEAARLLKRRAVLLTGDPRNMPKQSLSDGIAAFEYAPFGQILPRAAAIVHQGGVGTTGQSLRAGVPELVIPFNHDQPDNAFRVARLGVGRTISRTKYNARTAARELEILLTEKSYAERAAAIGAQVRSEDGAATAADAIEDFIADRRLEK